MVRRLRDRNEPILLFGETEYEAYQRLKKLEFEMPEVVNKVGDRRLHFKSQIRAYI